MSTPTPDNALNLLVQASRVSWELRAAVRAVEDHIKSLTLSAGEWRVSVADDGTRTVTPLVPGCICNVRSEDGASFDLEWADAPDSPSGEVVRAERVENGDPTDEG